MLTYEILRQNGLNGPIQGPLILNNNKILSRTLGVTEKDALIKIRIGQGLFKKKLKMIECQCKICGLRSKKL
ncbi:hypothetical protein [Clostridium estertheticum]|uniref:Uncharacterized protein n=1 Tax=Clostridium estertheticum TaxID=238834 RepID=A0A7Y3WTZ3_9CLOT|nr:hypothetical protein [Clostridium estertheticum]NNU77549.1 hypothetical protein [Clostridium estertheticum]WBL48510.1 hypothetical protein LOR37_07585 [Clostridium estertheticum]